MLSFYKQSIKAIQAKAGVRRVTAVAMIRYEQTVRGGSWKLAIERIL